MTAYARRAGALALAAAALLLPAHRAALMLAGESSPLVPKVATGTWIFKGFLLLHAILLAASSRLVLLPAGRGETATTDYKTSRADVWLILGLLVVGLALRLYNLGEGLWFDEIQTLVDYVRLPLPRIVTTFDSQNQHPLYTVLARGAFAVFGEAPWALRLPAALLGVASLWAAYRLGRMMTDRREALLATALLTFSYHHIWFSQNARGYTGLLLWTILGTLFFLRLLEGRYQSAWAPAVGYGVTMALGAYTHVTAAFVVIGHGLILLARQLGTHARAEAPQYRRHPLLGLFLATTFSLQLYAPILPQFLDTILHPANQGVTTEWQSPLWFMAETLRGLGRGLPGGWLALTCGALVVGAGIWSYWRQSPTLLALMLVPAMVSAVTLVATGHNLWPRFFFFAAWFGVLLVVRGGFALARAVTPGRGELVATTAVAIVILASASTIPGVYRPKQDFVSAGAFVERSLEKSDAVVTVDLTSYPYAKYFRRSWYSVESAAALEKIEREHPKTYVLYTFPTRLAAVQPDIWTRLQKRYVPAASFAGTVGGGAIVIMVNR